MVAPAGTRWLGIGQGSDMKGSNMFLIYTSVDNNVTLSPRLGRGDFEPDFNEAAEVELLGGSEVSADGVMTANIRCDSCIRWDGGSMEPASSDSSWIWAIKEGDGLDSNDTSESLNFHSAYGQFTFDLTAASGGDSANPFLQATTSPNDIRISDQSPNQRESSDGARILRSVHGIVMSVVFLALFPLGALTIYLPFRRKVVLIHAPLQILSVCLLIVGLAFGIVLGTRYEELDGYHQVIGYIVTACLILLQPLLGFLQHWRYKKEQRKKEHSRTRRPTFSPGFGSIHRWFGRLLIVVGIINGGLGLLVSGPVGSENVPTWSVIVYSLAAALVGLIYLSMVVCVGQWRRRKANKGNSTKT